MRRWYTALSAATRGDYEQQQQQPPKHDKKLAK